MIFEFLHMAALRARDGRGHMRLAGRMIPKDELS
jgi:hypothetical protein